MNKRTMKKGLAIVLALMMVFSMSTFAFANTTITPQPVTYPVNVDVTIFAEEGNVTDVTGTSQTVNDVYVEDSITFTAPFTTVFTQYLSPNPGSAHQLSGYPTVMDAICKAYQNAGGTAANITLGWDSNPSEGPQGAYISKLFGNSTITTVSGFYRWEGYSWVIYLNDTTKTWNEATRTGKIPYYASNVQIQSGDKVFVLFEQTEETW